MEARRTDEGRLRTSDATYSSALRVDVLATVTLGSAEVVHGGMQRQSVALLSPLLGRDLRLRAA